MNVRAWLVRMGVLVVVLAGCGSVPPQQGQMPAGSLAQPDLVAASATSSTSSISATMMRDRAQGFWEGRAGDINISEVAVGEIYNYDWYAIEFTSPTTALVVWDNGINCGRTTATVDGNELHLVADDVTTVFVIHDTGAATVTFQQGDRTWVKQLEKTRSDPAVVCL